jgi:hypothetical protein
MDATNQTASGTSFRWAQLGVGLLVLLIGLLTLLDRLDAIEFVNVFSFWPVIVIVVGLGKMFNEGGRCGRSGLTITLVGVWLLLNSLQLFGFHYGDSWPLLIVGVGLAHLVQPDAPDDRVSGLVMIGVGTVFLIGTQDWFGLDLSTSWPLFVILAGLAIMAKAFVRTAGSPAKRGSDEAIR